MEIKELTCIVCPLGCGITVTTENGEISKVCGNTCPRGEAYARKEVTDPTRIVTSTVRVSGGAAPMVSCKTQTDIPKDKIFDVMESLQNVVVPAPVHIKDVLVADAAGTGVAIVATGNVEVRENAYA